MGAPNRDEKVYRILKGHIGERIQSGALYEELSRTFRGRSSFPSARSLALYLRRYRFIRENKKYFIDKDKIEVARERIRIWRRKFP